MENNNEKQAFRYTYSAGEQAELKQLREKYAPTTEAEDKLTRLRRLDAGVTRRAQTVALSLGILGTLIFGAGMSLCMTDIGSALLTQGMCMVLGVIAGAVGAALMGAAYPAYNGMLRRGKRRVAPEILRLTDELMK